SQYEYLIDEFKEGLASMKEDGTYDAITQKWLGEDTSEAEITGDTKAKATPVTDTYIIASATSIAQLEYQAVNNNYTHLAMDLSNAIAKQQGFNIKINSIGFDAALNAVQSGQADGVIAGMTITDARKAIFNFSDPYYTTNIILAVKKGSSVKSYE